MRSDYVELQRQPKASFSKDWVKRKKREPSTKGSNIFDIVLVYLRSWVKSLWQWARMLLYTPRALPHHAVCEQIDDNFDIQREQLYSIRRSRRFAVQPEEQKLEGATYRANWKNPGAVKRNQSCRQIGRCWQYSSHYEYILEHQEYVWKPHHLLHYLHPWDLEWQRQSHEMSRHCQSNGLNADTWIVNSQGKKKGHYSQDSITYLVPWRSGRGKPSAALRHCRGSYSSTS